MSKRLDQSFYSGPTLDVAKALLGTRLVKDGLEGRVAGRIVEVEAYCGPEDRASHARWGPTRRAAIMFGPAGYWYVYFIYGVYHCLNIVTGRDGYPAAVLIRAVEPLEGLPSATKTDGPGKLCRAYGIDRTLNGRPACTVDAEVWIEPRPSNTPPPAIVATPRIGVNYAGEYKDKPWRYVIANSPLARIRKRSGKP